MTRRKPAATPQYPRFAQVQVRSVTAKQELDEDGGTTGFLITVRLGCTQADAEGLPTKPLDDGVNQQRFDKRCQDYRFTVDGEAWGEATLSGFLLTRTGEEASWSFSLQMRGPLKLLTRWFRAHNLTLDNVEVFYQGDLPLEAAS